MCRAVWPKRELLREQLVELVRLLAPEPGLDGLSVLHAVDEDIEAAVVDTVDGHRGPLEGHRVVVVADRVHELGLEGAAALLHELHEVPEDGLPPVVVTRQRAATRDVPHRVLGDDLGERLDVVVAKRLVAASEVLHALVLGHVVLPSGVICREASILVARVKPDNENRPSGRYRSTPTKERCACASTGASEPDAAPPRA